MRWIVYSLLALNLGLLTWNLNVHGASRGARPPTPPDFGPGGDPTQLPLLSELGTEALRLRVAAEGSPAGGDRAKGDASGARPVAGPTAATPATPATRSTQGAHPAGAGLPANAPPELDAEQPLLAEPGTVRHPDPTTTCLTLGPLDEDVDPSALRSWLEGRGAEVDVHANERREVALYWVYFPPRASREQAAAEVQEMQSRGIDDIVVVPKGDMANAISLGVFSRTETRDRRLRELAAKGYQPSIGPRYRTRLATWIDVSSRVGAVSETALAERWPEVGVASKPCPLAQRLPVPLQPARS